MERTPHVVASVEKAEGSLIDFVSNVYSSVIPLGLLSRENASSEKKPCEVGCADIDEHGGKIAFGYSTGGFSLWAVSGSKATEIITSTKESVPIRLIRIFPAAKPLTSSTLKMKEMNESVSWDEAMKRQTEFVGEETECLAYVEQKRDNVLKLYSISHVKVVGERNFSCPIDDVRCSTRFFCVLLKNHSVQVFPRIGNAEPFLIPHAHPMALGTRWIAYGAKLSLLEQHTPSESSSPSLQPQNAWEEITKTLAVSAFRLGEASSRKLTDYLSNSVSNDEFSGSCGCDTIIVQDCEKKRVLCKIPETSSYLSFDDSGSVLVSSLPQGQTLLVYSLPKGLLLYKLERGLSPAKIINVCFSPDRKWIAVTSARGTTHIFPVDPSGCKASISTHLTKGAVSKDAVDQSLSSKVLSLVASSPSGTGKETVELKPGNEPRYMKEFQAGLVSTSSLSRISPLTSHMPIRGVKFIDKFTVRIVSQNGFVDDYSLTPYVVGEKDQLELALDSRLVRTMDLTQDLNELDYIPISSAPQLSKTPPAVLPSSSGSYVESASMFELNPFHDPLVPIWASPDMAFFQTSADDFNTNSSMFYVPAGTQLVEVRESTPPPVGWKDATQQSAFTS